MKLHTNHLKPIALKVAETFSQRLYQRHQGIERMIRSLRSSPSHRNLNAVLGAILSFLNALPSQVPSGLLMNRILDLIDQHDLRSEPLDATLPVSREIQKDIEKVTIQPYLELTGGLF